MSQQANNSMGALKDIAGKLLAIVRTARQLPPGPSHFALATQASELAQARAVWDHAQSACIPGLVLSCSKELIWICALSPPVAPNWRSINHDDPRLEQHSWRPQILAWEALEDRSFDLPWEVDGVTSENVPGPSTSQDAESQAKGKGKAREVDPDTEKEMTNDQHEAP
ncbi:uncharacterized protein EDB91DRAFT_1088448 [Suillus paluster]|uniref:uncharacterized protein n=1 Tax=Suillus paluster TaxID=48578 RepID=UPI001B8636A1|nr:uncharacterized protein EDB91DRAFT_1088448 [Suillus paluster]KAG1721484.1 hypothetical protein EDB91DRAFT_1088448 [Suillus paluster]